ncbi:MAG TPA: cytochrome c [Burkholderiaceae bacterium]|jgi:mono/diheme cytochrome c family protein|nr:cytochrome c [Burkholderiaceae bacterium]
MKRWPALLGAAALAMAACSRSGSPVPDLNDAARLAAGRSVYARHCAACHGARLEGQPNWTTRRADGRLPAPPHDDSGHTWHHPMQVLFAITKHGLTPPHAPAGYESDMPAFGGTLTDEEIWNVLAFIRSRWSVEVRTRHDQLERQYANQRR